MMVNKPRKKCIRCRKEIPEEKTYSHQGKILCEDCALQAGLFPLGHTGQHKKSFYIKDRKG